MVVVDFRYDDPKGLGTFFMKAHAPNAFQDNGEKYDIDVCRGAFNLASTAGVQNSFGRAFNQGDNTIPGAITVGTSYEAVLNQHGITSAVDTYRKFQKSEVVCELQNAGNAPVKCRLYVCELREDIANLGDTSPQWWWNQYADNYDGGVGANQYLDTTIGATPYQAPGFGHNWKIIGDRSFRLSAGARTQFRLHKAINKILSQSDLGALIEASNNRAGIAHHTYGFILTIHGTPGSDTTTPASINYGASSVIGTWSWRMWSSIAQHPQITRYILLTNTLDPLAGSAQDQTVDETGVVTTFQTSA